MSRSSADLTLGIAPGAIAYVCGAERHVLRGEHPDPVRLFGALEAAVSARKIRTVRVVFSHRLVRHALTEAPGKTLSAVEETALVRARLIEIHGEDAAAWRVRAMSQPPAYGTLGAGLDETLCAAVENLAQRRGWTVQLLPLAKALPTPRSAARARAWIVAEPGWATLFYGPAGRYQHVASQPLSDDWHSELADWLERTAERIGATPDKASVVLQTVGLMASAPPTLAGWHWHLTQAAAGETDALALAMGAA